ncbi:MAG: hypothetical protein A2Y10_04175 [Planctomycetes bacterium GWF2_41_51]|nr:MAG: hypothetical protein A2Y10_04175 [Planctomycetes bacterium GWF2_41_51]HBG28316.1 cation-binding protein [Phycisphaerales bacterium]
MKPRGMLMAEHRLIERMLAIIEKEIIQIEKGRRINSTTIDSIVDFMKTFADLNHHGKEEDILFSILAKKEMTDEDSQMMQELIEEHKFCRKATEDIVQAKEDYLKGKDTIGIVILTLNSLVRFYPKHIQKEDEIFFPNSEIYLTDEELASMIKEFKNFDCTMFQNKYKQIIESLEQANGGI